MSADCLFCKIGAKKIPSKIVYEDDEVFAFEDIGPQAPTHILICPRKHFVSLDEAGPDEQAGRGAVRNISAPPPKSPLPFPHPRDRPKNVPPQQVKTKKKQKGSRRAPV